ncbi:hypothetical protein [Pannonibacter tanglangensis]|nr:MULTISPECIES: hypothetical protein [unclassified Pannonibacter]
MTSAPEKKTANVPNLVQQYKPLAIQAVSAAITAKAGTSAKR